MSRTVVISQSNYLPWKGYFDQINRADVFIFMDSVQYTRRDWRNRNMIKTPGGTSWLTIPVEQKNLYDQRIDEVQTKDSRWVRKHIASIEQNYSKALCFASESGWLFEAIESAGGSTQLKNINMVLTRTILNRLGIDILTDEDTNLIDRDKLIGMEPTERLVELCKVAGATRYLTGPAARDYVDEKIFDAAGIELAWMSYEGYQPYRQLWSGFTHTVSIVDMILNIGTDETAAFLKNRARILKL